MLQRVLAGAFGAVLIGIAVPVTYLLLIGVPESLMVLILLAAISVITGAVLGVLFPKFFGFIFEMFMDI